jgi:putative Flp pilus-assembly TadE/G-like protein
MNTGYTRRRKWSPERGQTFLAIAIFITMFLLAVLGLVTDYSQVWAHRQMAQGAADAACQAGAADLFLKGTDPTASTDFPTLDFSWIGSTFNCSTHATSPPCQYASLNGYSGSNVSVSFPSSLPGVSGIPAGFPTIANPYIKVTVTDPVATYFTRIVSSIKTVNVTASAGCGMHAINTPVPLVVLHTTANPSFQVNAGASVTVLGGPTRSIQVDSSSSTAVTVGTVDLHLAGPGNNGADFAVFGGPTMQPTGVNVGSAGHWIPGANPFGDPFAAVSAPASAPATNGTATPVPFGVNGCPDPGGCVEFTPGNYTGCLNGPIAPGAKGCLNLPFGGSRPRFNAGGTNWQPNHTYAAGTLIMPSTLTCASTSNSGGFVYMAITAAGNSAGTCPASFNQTRCTRQADGTCSGGTTIDGGVTWQNVGVVSTAPKTAIFDPGLYWVGSEGLNFGPGSTARISTATGDGSKGVMFYFSTSGSVSIGSSSGGVSACTSVPYPYTSTTPTNCVVAYQIDGSLSPAATGYVASRLLQCPNGSANPSLVPATIPGNVLLGPCGATSGIGATGQYGSPDGNRGFLFFQARSFAANGGTCTAGFGGTCAIMGGGGSFVFSGFVYLHNGNGTTCGTNTSCLTLAGGSGGNSFTIGNIVVDKISLTGGSAVKMILNPTATFSVLRPTLLQ